MSQSPITIALMGFEGTQQASLELFLSRHVDGFELVPEVNASAIIFNADPAKDLNQLEDRYREQFNKPGVVVSMHELNWPGMVSLRKPYGMKDLSLSLKQLKSQLHDQNSKTLGEPNETDLQKVLDEFRSKVNKGEDFYTEQKAQLSIKKAFQQQLMDRKRKVEQLSKSYQSEEESIEQLSVLLDQQTTHTGSLGTIEQDLEAMSKEVGLTQNQDSDTGWFVRSGYPGVPLLLDPSVQDIQDSCGNQPDVNLNAPAQRRNIFFNPEGQLYGVVLKAREKGLKDKQCQQIIGLPNQRLEYNHSTDQFSSSLDYTVLLQMAHARFAFGELQIQSVDDDKVDSTLERFDAESLLWRLACYSSNGRLMEGLSLEKPYKLDDQLPSNVIIDLPRTIAIIKLWQKETLTAIEVMQQLHVEQRFIFPFMTAAINLGWLK